METCAHQNSDGATAFYFVRGFLFDDLRCAICGKQISEIEFFAGPTAAEPFDSYPPFHERFWMP